MQLYYHDNKSIGGPSKVVGNIKSGLTLAGEKIEENSEILDPSKKVLKTNTFSTFPLFGPTKPPHIPITLAISSFSTSNWLR